MKIIGFVVTSLVLVGVILFVLNGSEQQSTTEKPNNGSAVQTDEALSDQIQLYIGDKAASFSFIEYIDYKCSSCARFHKTTWPEVKEAFIDTGKARLVIRNIPFIGPDSRRAAHASFCAAEQGLFEPFHDEVYSYTHNEFEDKGEGIAQQDILTTEKLSEFMQNVEGNMEEFNRCTADETYDSLIVQDLKSSESDQVIGTPTFIIGAQKITGPKPISVMGPIIEASL
jgi:protein-disulfide isomerase